MRKLPVTVALAEKLSALMTKDYLTARAKHGKHKIFEKVMSKVHDIEPEERDKF